jgi:hypothetical protein
LVLLFIQFPGRMATTTVVHCHSVQKVSGHLCPWFSSVWAWLIIGPHTRALVYHSKFLKKAKDSQEDWHHAPIWGHSCTHKLFPFYPADIATLQTLQINTVSQIFETHLSGGIDKTISPDLMTSLQVYPSLRHKLQLFDQAFQQMLFKNKYASPRLILATFMHLDTNMSRRNKLLCRSILDADQTRTRDNVHIRPTIPTFTNAYQLLRLLSLTSKTLKTAFQVLNRTMWTNNKAYKSKMRNNLYCERYGDITTPNSFESNTSSS